MPQGPRKFWGWGYEGQDLDDEHRATIAAMLAARFGCEQPPAMPIPRIEDVELPAPRLQTPNALAAIVSTAPLDRAGHTYGKAFRDVVRALRRDFGAAPDAVAYPGSEDELLSILDWCTEANAAAIPYGGGSSVVGGIEARIDGRYAGAVSVDLSRLDRVLETDTRSRAARIQAGVYGPHLEDQLRPHGLTLRHFPQSFELSTLGGWIATRSGGHYATLYTHIDDFVEALRVVTPAGIVESRRLPGSGAGPSPDRLFIGSEGILGVITEAWMRLQDRPRYRASASLPFKRFLDGARAVQAIGQAGLYPSNLRLLDAAEAETTGAGDGRHAVLILGFESADHGLDPWMQRALEIARDHGAQVPADAGKTRTDEQSGREGAAGAWRQAFLRAPYVRDALTVAGFISDTFETAVCWDGFEDFHARIMDGVGRALRKICGAGSVTCRFTHVYPDGPAPYFTILAPARAGSQIEQWDEIKAAASELVVGCGGTITHHHAVGRDHRPWYDRQRPPLFAAALQAAKRTLDPAAVMNPGVLLDSP